MLTVLMPIQQWIKNVKMFMFISMNTCVNLILDAINKIFDRSLKGVQ